MSPATKKILEKFAASANWSTVALLPDMERFEDFIIAAYRNGEFNISLDEFLDVIGQATTGEHDDRTKKRQLASKMFMFSKYEDGIRLLRKFEGTSNA